MKKQLLAVGFVLLPLSLSSVEIPLEQLSGGGGKVGYVDLQKIFETFPEKSFAEGDLLKEVEKRKRDLDRRQTLINLLRQQISADETALKASKSGQAVFVPVNLLPKEEQRTNTGGVSASTDTKKSNTNSVAAYPTEDPLLGAAAKTLLGADQKTTPDTSAKDPNAVLQQSIPALGKSSLLDQLSSSTAPVTLQGEALSALQTRVDDNRKALNYEILEFRSTRGKAIDDMKALNQMKTHDIMSKIYALLQNIAREESLTLVLDKAHIIYGEETIDLTDKLIAKLRDLSA